MDNGFKTALYPSMTAMQLRAAFGEKAKGELARRIAVDAGDATLATDGDKLHGRVGKRSLIENGGQY